MAVGVGIVKTSKKYPGQLTFRVFITCVVAGMGGLIFGYDIGISGTDNETVMYTIYMYFSFIF
jgi:hypothetical protein